jgi:predicted nucleic acid-binding protein
VNSTTVPGLLDTGVLVACVGGHPRAITFFLAVIRSGPPVSQLSVLEVLAGCQTDAERARALRFTSTLHVLDLNDAIAKRAFDLLTAITLPPALTASDALIAATALEHSLPLYTLDPARFAAVPGLTALRPY